MEQTDFFGTIWLLIGTIWPWNKMTANLFGLAQVQEDALNIPVAYYTGGSKAFFPIRKFHAKYLGIYEANFAIAEVHADFNIMDTE